MRILIGYLKNPHYLKRVKIDWSQFFLLIIVYFILAMFLSFIIGILGMIFKFKNTLNDLSPKIYFEQALLLAPLFEECIFRLLLKPSYRNLLLFIVIIFPLLCYEFFIGHYVIFIVLILFVSIVLLVICKGKEYIPKLYKKYIIGFPFLFYMSVFSFGFVHVYNIEFIEFNFWLLLFVPVLVSPQMLLGGILGFIRMQYGFIYSVLFHIIVNGFVTVFVLI